MPTVKVYLAGSCFNEPDGGREWRKNATKLLTQAAEWCDSKCEVINPINYFSYDEHKHKTNKQVKRFFLNQIRRCDLVLVNLKNTASSCGTAQETQFAMDNNIPIIGFDDENSYPWISEVDCDVVFNNLIEAVDYIRDYYMKNYE